ncbi:unnamed protein product [Rangifer tarandus platyrhynchus]|uniref:Uncharacterized protein n=1 Tax=Rangifer tarandus platyrhynchus TaxID=3082113 RepID=A0AC59YYZ2_RANTA
MPDALVFCDPCVAGPQTPGRTGTENALAAPGTLPAEPSLPCPVTQTRRSSGVRVVRAHISWMGTAEVQEHTACDGHSSPDAGRGSGCSALLRAPPDIPVASPSSSVPRGWVPSRPPLAQGRQVLVGGYSAS